jgi:hypothetical protein
VQRSAQTAWGLYDVVQRRCYGSRCKFGLWCKQWIRDELTRSQILSNHAAKTAAQISDGVCPLVAKNRKSNCLLRIRCMSSTPRIVMAAEAKLFRPSTAPSLDWCVALDPAQDCRVSDRQAPLRHHLDQIMVGELISQVPAHAQNDDLLREVSTLSR